MSDELKAGRELDEKLANLLGDDLKARDDVELMTALHPFFCWGSIEPHPSYPGKYRERLVEISTSETFSVGLEDYNLALVYKNRKGKPYQAIVEAAVAEYRRTPPAYSTDGNAMLALIKEMRKPERDMYCDIHIHTEQEIAENWTPLPFVVGFRYRGTAFPRGKAETLPEAVALAAHAALTAQADRAERPAE